MDQQAQLINGMLNKPSLLRILRTSSVFMDTDEGPRISDDGPDLQLREGRFRLQRALIEAGGVAAARQAFEAYYTDKGLERVGQRVAYYAPKVGVEVAAVKVKDMGYRWASCGRSGVLNFHWKSMMAPPRIIDYIAVHELCHLHHRDHNGAFWNEVDKVMPDYRERKEWLRRYGASLDL